MIFRYETLQTIPKAENEFYLRVQHVCFNFPTNLCLYRKEQACSFE